MMQRSSPKRSSPRRRRRRRKARASGFLSAHGPSRRSGGLGIFRPVFGRTVHGLADYAHNRNNNMEGPMVDKFEDHCWQDVIPADDLAIYATFGRETFVGSPAALVAIDLYE